MRKHHYKTSEVRPAPVNADINVTPLVDVCLVLLIIFMVITPLLQKGVDVALPTTGIPDKIPETEKQLTVAIKMDGSIFIGPDWIPKNQVQTKLKTIKRGRVDPDVGRGRLVGRCASLASCAAISHFLLRENLRRREWPAQSPHTIGGHEWRSHAGPGLPGSRAQWRRAEDLGEFLASMRAGKICG